MLSLREFKSLSKFFEKSADLYHPAYPPFSPITSSHFAYWQLFDVTSKQYGTIAQYFLSNIAKDLDIPFEVICAIESASFSRMGIYENLDFKNGVISLKELVLEKSLEATCPAGI